MSTFGRGLSDKLETALAAMARADKPNWWKDLLALWAPSGSDIGERCLRLAVRRGYLNFYRNGQSVAKVGLTREERPYADVHVKYAFEPAIKPPCARLLNSTVTHAGRERSEPYLGMPTLLAWSKRAGRKAGKEKIFVDRLVGASPSVIDVEAALPGFINEDDKNVARRMDLVALEPHGEHWRLAFWEAKMMDNSELRRDNGDAKVVDQLKNYKGWLTDDKRTLFATAYQEVCEVLGSGPIKGIHRAGSI